MIPTLIYKDDGDTVSTLIPTPMFARVLARRIPHVARKASLRSYATMFGDNCPLVVSPAQLHNLKASQPSPADLVVLDASWHMPNSPRKADTEYRASHIPSARFLDIDRVASPHPLSLPHMMPDPKTFVEACCKDMSFKQVTRHLNSCHSEVRHHS